MSELNCDPELYFSSIPPPFEDGRPELIPCFPSFVYGGGEVRLYSPRLSVPCLAITCVLVLGIYKPFPPASA